MLHFPDNKSDHSPIYCIVSFPVIQKEVCEPVQQRPRPNWSKANIDEKAEYKSILGERIGNLTIPPSLTSCRDVKCRDPVHIEELDTFTMDLLETMQNMAEESLPMPSTGGSGSKQQKTVPGWGEAVRRYRVEAYFLASGRPLNTEIHKIMKRTKINIIMNIKSVVRLNGGVDLCKEIKTMRKLSQPNHNLNLTQLQPELG